MSDKRITPSAYPPEELVRMVQQPIGSDYRRRMRFTIGPFTFLLIFVLVCLVIAFGGLLLGQIYGPY